MATVLSIKEYLKSQIILVDYTPLLYPIHLANINKKCYRGLFKVIPDYSILVLTLEQISIVFNLKVKLTSYSRSSVKYLLSYLLNLSIIS